MRQLSDARSGPSSDASSCAIEVNEYGKIRKELIFSIVLLVFVALFIVFLIMSKGGGRRTIVREGDRAPEFTLPAIDGSSVSLSGLRGKVVLVHFWATWCPPCIEEMPKLEALARMFAGSKLEILAVSVDDDDAEVVRAFIRKQDVHFPVLLNPGGAVAKQYGTFKYPETYVVDRSGTVRYKVIGSTDWTAPDTVAALRRLVDEQ